MAKVIIEGLTKKQADGLSNFLNSSCNNERGYALFFAEGTHPVVDREKYGGALLELGNGDRIIFMRTHEEPATLKVGATVKTLIDQDRIANDWTQAAIQMRRSGIRGKVIAEHNSHGECYDVKHEDDGSIGCYEPHELIIGSRRLSGEASKILRRKH